MIPGMLQEVTHGLAGRVPHVVLRDGQLALGVPAHTAGEHGEGHRALVVEHVLNTREESRAGQVRKVQRYDTRQIGRERTRQLIHDWQGRGKHKKTRAPGTLQKYNGGKASKQT